MLKESWRPSSAGIPWSQVGRHQAVRTGARPEAAGPKTVGVAFCCIWLRCPFLPKISLGADAIQAVRPGAGFAQRPLTAMPVLAHRGNRLQRPS